MLSAGERPAWARAHEACQRQRHAPLYLGLGMIGAVAIMLATGRLVVRGDGALLYPACRQPTSALRKCEACLLPMHSTNTICQPS